MATTSIQPSHVTFGDVVRDIQEDADRDINTLIDDLAKVPFDKLNEEHSRDKIDKRNIEMVKFGFSITSICLAVIAVITAIATIIFSSGVLTPGTETLAVVTGFVGISTSFNQLDNAIYRYLNSHKEQSLKKSRIQKLKQKIDDIKGLLSSRINTLENISSPSDKQKFAGKVLCQIKRVNTYITRIKKQVPEKVTLFAAFNPAPLQPFLPPL